MKQAFSLWCPYNYDWLVTCIWTPFITGMELLHRAYRSTAIANAHCYCWKIKSSLMVHSYCPRKRRRSRDTDNKYAEPKGNLCCHLSLCSENTSIQSYANHFLLVLISISVSVSANDKLWMDVVGGSQIRHDTVCTSCSVFIASSMSGWSGCFSNIKMSGRPVSAVI